MNKVEMVFLLVHLAMDGEETGKYKISYASLRLKGAAKEWFNLRRRLLISGTWKKFREDFIERFDPSIWGSIWTQICGKSAVDADRLDLVCTRRSASRYLRISAL